MLEAKLLAQLSAVHLRFERGEVLGSVRTVCLGCGRYRRAFTDYQSAKEWAESLASDRDVDTERALIAVSRSGATVALLELVATGDTLTIALLLVASSARFAGLGRSCVEAVAHAAEALGYVALSLGVHVTNTDALAFWSRLGFSDSGFIGHGDSAILQMERVLASSTGVYRASSSVA